MKQAKHRVLLLEPNQLLAAQCTRALEQRGYSVTWCMNAQDAVNAADSHKPDIVVLELLLTAHSGIEFLYEFRSYSEWRNIPVVLFSRISRADLPTSDKVLKELGVSQFLYKPETSLARLGERLDALTKRPAAEQV